MEDKDRIINISKLRLEKQFYFIFRKLAKYHLNLFKNYKTRTKIEDILSDDTILYLNKLNNITNILKPFLSPFIEFSTYEEKVLEKILNIE